MFNSQTNCLPSIKGLPSVLSIKQKIKLFSSKIYCFDYKNSDTALSTTYIWLEAPI